MKYAIVTNPVAGGLSPDRKQEVLKPAAAILDAKVYGLDTRSVEEFQECIRETAQRCDVLVAAGGDGTFSDMINAVDTARRAVGYLPLGSGNAMRHALGYPRGIADAARQIRNGAIRKYDLIDCDHRRRAFMASAGIDAAVIKFRDRFRMQGEKGILPYFKAAMLAWLTRYRPAAAEIDIDGQVFHVRRLLSLSVVKQPYYGYGLKFAPHARFDDRQLHILCLDADPLTIGIGALTIGTIGNRAGRYLTGKEVTVRSAARLRVQTDGNIGWAGKRFSFSVLSEALRIKC